MGDIGIIFGSDKMDLHGTSLDTVPSPREMGFFRSHIHVFTGPRINPSMGKKIGLGQALLELDVAYVNNGQGRNADGCV